MSISYGLVEDLAGTVEQDGEQVPAYTGGLIRAGETDVNVRELLDSGNGTITVNDGDADLVNALDAYPALKRVQTPKDATPVDSLEALNLAALRERARTIYGLEGTGRASKASIIKAIRTQQTAAAAGEPIPTSVDDAIEPEPELEPETVDAVEPETGAGDPDPDPDAGDGPKE